MTPETATRLKRLGLNQRQFARLADVSEDTVSGWGKRHREARGVQKEPTLVHLLLSAWEACPAVIPRQSD